MLFPAPASLLLSKALPCPHFSAVLFPPFSSFHVRASQQRLFLSQTIMINFSEQLTPIFSRTYPPSLNTRRAPPAQNKSKIYPPPSIPSVKNFFLYPQPRNKVLCFQSKDGKQLFVELPVAMQMLYFRKAYAKENFDDHSKIQVDFVCGDILAYVLYFCMVKSKVEEGILRSHEAESLCFGFSEKLYVLQDTRTIYHVLEAATSLEVDLLRDLFCEVIVKLVNELPPEKVTEAFDVDLALRDPTRID